MKYPSRLVGAVILGTVFGGLMLTACGGSKAPAASGTTTTGVIKGSTTTSAAPVTSTTAVGSTTTTSGAAQNLPATAAIKTSITAVYVAHNNLPASQVAGTVPGSVYYGYVPSTQTYWAIATFEPNSTATMQTQVSMQDDGCCGIFSMASDGSWTYVSGYLGSPCSGQIPAALMALWNLTSPGDCAPTTTTS